MSCSPPMRCCRCAPSSVFAAHLLLALLGTRLDEFTSRFRAMARYALFFKAWWASQPKYPPTEWRRWLPPQRAISLLTDSIIRGIPAFAATSSRHLLLPTLKTNGGAELRALRETMVREQAANPSRAECNCAMRWGEASLNVAYCNAKHSTASTPALTSGGKDLH